MARRARHLATQAREPAPHYEHVDVGFNYRLSNLLAALGRSQLADLDRRVAARRRIFDRYAAALSAVEGISMMPEAPYGTSNRWLTCITVDAHRTGFTAEDLRLRLEAADVESRPTWKPMHLQPVFRGLRTIGGEVAEDLFARGLCLPSGSSLSPADRERVIGEILHASAATQP